MRPVSIEPASGVIGRKTVELGQELAQRKQSLAARNPCILSGLNRSEVVSQDHVDGIPESQPDDLVAGRATRHAARDRVVRPVAVVAVIRTASNADKSAANSRLNRLDIRVFFSCLLRLDSTSCKSFSFNREVFWALRLPSRFQSLSSWIVAFFRAQ